MTWVRPAWSLAPSAQLVCRRGLWVDFLSGSPSEIICNPGLGHREDADRGCHTGPGWTSTRMYGGPEAPSPLPALVKAAGRSSHPLSGGSSAPSWLSDSGNDSVSPVPDSESPFRWAPGTARGSSVWEIRQFTDLWKAENSVPKHTSTPRQPKPQLGTDKAEGSQLTRPGGRVESCSVTSQGWGTRPGREGGPRPSTMWAPRPAVSPT